MSDDTKIVVTGGVDAADLLYSSSLDPDGNLNFRRLDQRDLYNRLVTGAALRSEVGQALTHSDGSPVTDLNAEPPEWTQSHTGLEAAYVLRPITELTSSFLNVSDSGSFALETTAVPASGTIFYSKFGPAVTKTYKLTASLDMIDDPMCRADHFDSAFGLQFSSSFHFHTASDPWVNHPGPLNPNADHSAKFKIDVPDVGRLVDIKVWVEFLHNSGSDIDDLGDPAGFKYDNTDDREWSGCPLGHFWIVLRPPNTPRGFFSLPWENDPRIVKRVQSEFGEVGTGFWGSSYPLWIGRSASDGSRGAVSYIADRPSQLGTLMRDRHMRVVFHEGSQNNNPYRLDPLYVNTSISGSGLADKSLASVSGNIRMPGPVSSSILYGSNRPWTTEIVDRTISGETGSFNNGSGSPPVGWLTGPGGTNAENEWPTTGSTNLFETIKPAIPMLPDLYGRIKIQDLSVVDGDGKLDAGNSFDEGDELGRSRFHSGSGASANWAGVRPGMRGTQIKGAWELMVINCSPSLRGNSDAPAKSPRTGLSAVLSNPPSNVKSWFRQFRLELTYMPGSKPSLGKTNDLRFVSQGKRFSSVTSEGIKLGDRVAVVSGAAPPYFWDSPTDTYRVSFDFAGNLVGGDFEAELFEVVQDSPYTTVGITDSSASDDFAVYTRLTGALALEHGESPHWFLGPANDGAGQAQNPFGTPFIPLSSASSDVTFQPSGSLAENRKLISDVLDPKTAVREASTLSSILTRYKTTQTTADAISESLKSSDED